VTYEVAQYKDKEICLQQRGGGQIFHHHGDAAQAAVPGPGADDIQTTIRDPLVRVEQGKQTPDQSWTQMVSEDGRTSTASTIDILSGLKGGDSLEATCGTRGVRVGYRFVARCRNRFRSYLRSTVV
jgi:hypothetical protein